MAEASLKELGCTLSSPFEDELTDNAARTVLSASDPSMMMRRLYPVLIQEKGIRAAFDHLKRAGADLEELSVPTSTVCNTFPMTVARFWPAPSEPQWTLADLADVLTRHRELMWQATLDLARRMGPQRVILLSGSAMESLYPAYKGRVGFDTDLWVPKLSDGLDALEVLVGELGYELRYAHLITHSDDSGSELRISAAATKRVDGFLIAVGIVSGGYRFYAEPLDRRSLAVDWDAQPLQAASAEDLLLMLGVRVQGKRLVQMANIVDAEVILSGGASLDHSLVGELSRKYGLNLPLGILLTQVNARRPGAVPDELRTLLKGVPRLYPALAYQSLGAPDRHLSRRGANFAFEVSETQRSRPTMGWTAATGSVLYGRLGTRIALWQNAVRSRFGMDSVPIRDDAQERLPLCGAADPQGTRALSECVANKPGARWADSVGDEIHETADRLVSLMPEESHDCSRIWALI